MQSHMEISEAQVRVLYHYRYLPLLACHERQQAGQLEKVAQQVGLLLTLDELASEGGERSEGVHKVGSTFHGEHLCFSIFLARLLESVWLRPLPRFPRKQARRVVCGKPRQRKRR